MLYAGYVRVITYLILVFPLFLQAQTVGLAPSNKATMSVKYYQVQDRYEYGARLLVLALSKLEEHFVLEAPATQNMNEARGNLEVITGRLDVQWLSTTTEREEKMLSIKVPIYRGVLGLRLLLANQEKRDVLKNIESIEGLREFVGGHGTHWGDLPIYAANNLRVATHVKYKQLFEMLINDRFDYFHRGVNEIWGELERYKERLSIVEDVMLFYPHPVYFFVSKQRPELAFKLEKGLRFALEDGSFQQLFLDMHGVFIEKAALKTRRLIVLKNPVLPANTPSLDTSWWLPEKFVPTLEANP